MDFGVRQFMADGEGKEGRAVEVKGTSCPVEGWRVTTKEVREEGSFD